MQESLPAYMRKDRGNQQGAENPYARPTAEPVKAEPVKTEEPVRTEPVRMEPVRTEPKENIPAKTEDESAETPKRRRRGQ